MFNTILKLEIPEYVDDYVTDSVLPVNILASVDTLSLTLINTTLSVRIGERVTEFRYPPSTKKVDIPLPIELGRGPAEYKMVVELSDNNAVQTALRKKFKTTGSHRLNLFSENLADSIYVRMEPFNIGPAEEMRTDDSLQFIRPCPAGVDPRSPDICNYLESAMEYFSQRFGKVKKMPVRDKDGLMDIVLISDAMETNEADAFTMGLMFSNLFITLGYLPALLLYNDTCLFGLKVRDPNPVVPLTRLEVDDRDHCTFGGVRGEYLLIDMSAIGSEDAPTFDDARLAATKLFETRPATCTCLVEHEREREKFVAENILSSKQGTNHGGTV